MPIELPKRKRKSRKAVTFNADKQVHAQFQKFVTSSFGRGHESDVINALMQAYVDGTIRIVAMTVTAETGMIP